MTWSTECNDKKTALIEVMETHQAIAPIQGREDLINILGYISLLSKITTASMEAFKRKEWPKFDALVGDCGCQMRATKIKDLADLFVLSADWRQEIELTLQEAQSILQRLELLKQQIDVEISNDAEFKSKYGESVLATTVCKEFEICQRVSDDIRFIIESFLLTQTKMITPRRDCFYKNYFETTNPMLLTSFNSGFVESKTTVKDGLTKKTKCKSVGIVGKNKLIQLVRSFQRDLAYLSIEHTKKEASLLKPTSKNLYAQIIFDRFVQKDELSRPCIPLFYCMESLMQRIIQKKQNVLIDVKRWTDIGKLVDHIKLLYKGDPSSETLKQVAWDERNLPECVIVFIGCSVRPDQDKITKDEYIKSFNAITFEEILNVLAAQHPQYTGKMDQKYPLPVDPRFNNYVKKAGKIGCTLEDMSLFMITHIYCERLKSEFIDLNGS